MSKKARIKLVIEPYNERLFLMTNPKNAIKHLKEEIIQTLWNFPLYHYCLQNCTVILELRISGQNFAVKCF